MMVIATVSVTAMVTGSNRNIKSSDSGSDSDNTCNNNRKRNAHRDDKYKCK